MRSATVPGVERLLAGEVERFEREHPRSRELSQRARRSLLAGVPMHWMVAGPAGSRSIAVEALGRALSGRRRQRVRRLLPRRHRGDDRATRPSRRCAAIASRSARGITLMLPTEDALWVGEELARRFGLPRWQFALTATDANRFAIRLARRGHRAAEDPRLQLVLPRHRRRDVRDARPARPVVAREGNVGPPVAAERDDARRRVERRRRARAPRSRTATSPACSPSRR